MKCTEVKRNKLGYILEELFWFGLNREYILLFILYILLQYIQ